MNINEYLAFITEDKENIRAFHLSRNVIKILMPRIPNNSYTRMGYEDGKIARISMCPNVDHCLLAFGFNKLTHLREQDKTFRVYEPADYNKIKIITNQEIIRRKLVPDAKQTKEFWLMTRTPVKEIAKIKLLKPTKRYVTAQLPYGKKPGTPAWKRKLFFWDWKVIEGKI